MNKLFRIIGIVSGLVVTVMFVIVNLTITHVDLFLVEGDVWVFLVIMGAFLAGYFAHILVAWLKRTRKPKRSSESLERSIVGDI
jgi:uncharacterized integral membrane protein